MARDIRFALVTGADGFIGSHLVDLLLSRGIKVRALCQYNSFNSWGWLDNVRHPGLEIVCGDVRDAAFCRHISPAPVSGRLSWAPSSAISSS